MHSNEAVRYMSNDILLDLTDKIADSDKLEMDKFPEDIKEMYQWDGKNIRSTEGHRYNCYVVQQRYV